MNVLNKIVLSIQTYPVRWTSFIRAVILMLVGFGIHLSGEQITSLMLVVELGFGLFTHSQVTPNVKINTIDIKVKEATDENAPSNPIIK